MRTCLFAALILLAPLASAQDLSTTLAASDALSETFIVIEVAPEDLPEGLIETLQPLPENATVLTLDAPDLGYQLPQSVVGMASEKDATIGLILSIVLTGGGHLYAGETSKGLTLLAIGVGAPVAGLLLSSDDNYAPYLVGALVGLGAYVYGIFDGLKAVERTNAANGFAVVPAPVGGAGYTGAGLAMRIGL